LERWLLCRPKLDETDLVNHYSLTTVASLPLRVRR
jgi:hypothetical protein